MTKVHEQRDNRVNLAKLTSGVKLAQRVVTEQLWLTKNRLKELLNPNIILVCTMPKTGSSTIYASLRTANLPYAVYHTHLFTDDLDERWDASEQRGYQPPARKELNEIKRLRELFDSTDTKRWKVITLVREPISRCLSSLFQGWRFFLKDIDQDDLPSENLARVQLAFIERAKTCYQASQEWYPQQINDVFGIDIFSHPFPREKGYAFYQGPKTDLLLLKLENLNHCYQSAFKEWLGVENFRLVEANVAENKRYVDLYQAVSKKVVVPNEMIERMYTLDCVRHFYTHDEITKFKARWSQR